MYKTKTDIRLKKDCRFQEQSYTSSASSLSESLRLIFSRSCWTWSLRSPAWWKVKENKGNSFNNMQAQTTHGGWLVKSGKHRIYNYVSMSFIGYSCTCAWVIVCIHAKVTFCIGSTLSIAIYFFKVKSCFYLYSFR